MIILTTHHLDEAEILSDHVAIIHQGRLLLEGTVGDMKEEFGGGCYQLTVKRKNKTEMVAADTSEDPLYRQISRLLPDVERVATRTEGEERYFIPASDGDQQQDESIIEIVGMLENESAELGVESYSVDCTSLQQIFMAVVGEASGENKDVAGSWHMKNYLSKMSAAASDSGIDSVSAASSDRQTVAAASSTSISAIDIVAPAATYCPPQPDLLTGGALLWSQLRGLWYKQLMHYLRDWRFIVTALVLPLVLIIATMVLAMFRPEAVRPPRLLTPSLYGPGSSSFLR